MEIKQLFLKHAAWEPCVKSSLSGFVECLQALGTDVEALGHSINDHRHLLDVRFPLALSALVGVGNVLAKLSALTADITFSHIIAPFVDFAYDIITSRLWQIGITAL